MFPMNFGIGQTRGGLDELLRSLGQVEGVMPNRGETPPGGGMVEAAIAAAKRQQAQAPAPQNPVMRDEDFAPKPNAIGSLLGVMGMPGAGQAAPPSVPQAAPPAASPMAAAIGSPMAVAMMPGRGPQVPTAETQYQPQQFTPGFIPSGLPGNPTPQWANTPAEEQMARQAQAYNMAQSQIMGAGNPWNPMGGPTNAQSLMIRDLAGQIGSSAQATADRSFRGDLAGAEQANRMNLQGLQNQGQLDVANANGGGNNLTAPRLKLLGDLSSGKITPDQYKNHNAMLAPGATNDPVKMEAAAAAATAQANSDNVSGQIASLLGNTGANGFEMHSTIDWDGFLDRYGAASPADQAAFLAKAKGGSMGDPEKILAGLAPRAGVNYLRAQPPTYPSGPNQGKPINFSKELFGSNAGNMLPSSYSIPIAPGKADPLFSMGTAPRSKVSQFGSHLIGRDIRAAGVPYDQINLPGGRSYPIPAGNFLDSANVDQGKATNRARTSEALLRAFLGVQ